MKKLLVILILFLVGFFLINTVNAFSESLNMNIQVADDNGNPSHGTYLFVFNISSDSLCENVLYSNKITMATDSRGVINYTLKNINIDFNESSFYLCYYRDGILKGAQELSSVPYSYYARNANETNYWRGYTPESYRDNFLNSSVQGSTSASNIDVLFTNGFQLSSYGVLWNNSRGSSELNGTNIYGSNSIIYGGGFVQVINNTITIDAIQADVWCNNSNRNVTMKVYSKSSPFGSGISLTSTDLVYETNISSSVFPHSEGNNTIQLNTNLTIFANHYIYVLFYTNTSAEIRFRYFNTQSSGPIRSGMPYITNSGGMSLYNGESSNYFSAGFNLLGTKSLTSNITENYSSNLISNSGLEMSGSPSYIFSGWAQENSTGGTIQNETVTIHSGISAAKLIANGVAWYSPNIRQTVNVNASTEYSFSFWTRGDGTSAGQFSIYDATHSSYLRSIITTGCSSASYQLVTYNFTTPIGTNQIIITFYPGAQNGNTAYFDDVSLVSKTYIYTPISIKLLDLLQNLVARMISFSDPNGRMTSTNVQDAIIEAYNHGGGDLSAGNASLYPRIIMPNEVTAVVGDKFQLFVRPTIEAMNPYIQNYYFDALVGNAYPRYYELTPTSSQIGNYTLGMYITDFNFITQGWNQTKIVVVNNSGSPKTNVNVMIVGDSLTAGGTWASEFGRRLIGTGGTPSGNGYANITMIGNFENTSDANLKWVGYGGWTWGVYTNDAPIKAYWINASANGKTIVDQHSTYSDSNGHQWTLETIETDRIKINAYGGASTPLPSMSGTLSWVSGGSNHGSIIFTDAAEEVGTPFWNSTSSSFSIKAFVNSQEASDLNIVYILLGWNGLPGNNKISDGDFATQMGYARNFLNILHSEYPNAQVRIMGIEDPSSMGGLGANYGATGSGMSNYFGVLRTVNGLNRAYQDLCLESAYTGWCRYVDVASQFDSEYNLMYSNVSVDSRNSINESRGTNGVHPATNGYYQIADVAYRDFIRSYCSW